MNIKICKLKPEHAEDYALFFDKTPHNEECGGEKCYCVTWRSGGWGGEGGDHWFPTQEERRARAVGFVKDGYIQGYLAYDDERIVGFCNANADCQGCVDYLRSFNPIEEYREDIRVKSIFCYMVAPEMQRKGIATQLCERVCKDAAEDGLDYVEAYVYNGSLMTMYEKCGFVRCAEREGHVVVRKALK
ncbi:MAG: GNAT family N-acetyltransferase [Defluviitaleaceae bacterium]|nr:GNAT family N-acetyltransferase [Defluviitaleaceae bacterium]